MNKDQATQIHDIESYKEITGAKRFKRTKEEMALGLSPQEALQERLKALQVGAVVETVQKKYRETARQHSNTSAGEITIKIRPAAGVPAEYFERIGNKIVTMELCDKAYGWLDTKLQSPYDNDIGRLMEDVIDKGLDEVITHMNFPEDLKEGTAKVAN